jgi:uncharacterized protein YcnI
MRHPIALGALVALAALTFSASAFAHAHISPPLALSGEGQVFTLAVPNEEEAATITAVEITPPDGFSMGSLLPAAGWKATAKKEGTSDEARVLSVEWTGGSTPPGEAAAFSFLGSSTDPGTFAFAVKQTYSNGKVVTWSGPESSDTPSPVVETSSSLGGGGGSSTLDIVAIALAGVALVLVGAALLAFRGRPLT